MSTPWFLPAPLVDVAALALWWGLLRLSRRRDNRRLRNGLLFLLLVGATARALLHLASLIPALKLPVGLSSAAFFLLIALMPFLLMFNGVVLIRREGRRLSNLLCLAAGLGLIATPMAASALVATGNPWALLERYIELLERNVAHRDLTAIYTATAVSVLDAEHPAHRWMANHLNSAVERFESSFEAGKTAGLVDPQMPSRLVARSLVALIDGLQLQWLCSTTPMRPPGTGSVGRWTSPGASITSSCRPKAGAARWRFPSRCGTCLMRRSSRLSRPGVRTSRKP